MPIRKRLQLLIKVAGWTQGEIARRLGEPTYWVNDRIKGRVEIKADELRRFADAFGINSSQLCAVLFADEEPDYVEALARSGAARSSRATAHTDDASARAEPPARGEHIPSPVTELIQEGLAEKQFAYRVEDTPIAQVRALLEEALERLADAESQ